MISDGTMDTKRRQLYFTVEGLSVRHEFVLKSMIAILNFRTKHDWQFDRNHANITIFDQPSFLDEHSQENKQTNIACKRIAFHTLQFDCFDGSHFRAIDICQLSAVKVEETLNRMGDECSQMPEVSQATEPAIFTPIKNVAHTESYRLTQWPPQTLLQNISRVRMAAVLTGLPRSQADIINTTGVEPENCEKFISELKMLGLLLITKSEVKQKLIPVIFNESTVMLASNVANSKPLSLFARIRNRLTSVMPKSA